MFIILHAAFNTPNTVIHRSTRLLHKSYTCVHTGISYYVLYA